MQVNATNQMQQMHQMQMHKGQGQGGGKGMGQVMQSLSEDQRQDISQMLQSIPQEDRKDIVSQIKSLDVSSMSQDDLYNSIKDILNPTSSENIITASTINTYA